MRSRTQTPAKSQAVVLSTKPVDDGVGPMDLDDVGQNETDDAPVTVAYEIETTTDALNEGLVEAQKALVGLNLGTEGSVEIENSAFERIVLAFRKMNTGWKLVLEETGPDGERATELLSAAREMRIIAATKLDELLSQLLDESLGRLKRLRDAVEHVESFRERIARERIR